tara:strand:+ start:261 stop:563 length:303 start_codon:yes stop_codon:yes gene_type:complete
LIVGFWLPSQQSDQRHHNAWRAKSTLKCAPLHQLSLKRMHLITIPKTFYCVDPSSVGTASRDQARADSLPIHQYRASSTLTITASDLCATQSQIIAQDSH